MCPGAFLSRFHRVTRITNQHITGRPVGGLGDPAGPQETARLNERFIVIRRIIGKEHPFGFDLTEQVHMPGAQQAGLQPPVKEGCSLCRASMANTARICRSEQASRLSSSTFQPSVMGSSRRTPPSL